MYRFTVDAYQRLPDALKENRKAIAAMNSDCEYRLYEKKIASSFRTISGTRSTRATTASIHLRSSQI